MRINSKKGAVLAAGMMALSLSLTGCGGGDDGDVKSAAKEFLNSTEKQEKAEQMLSDSAEFDSDSFGAARLRAGKTEYTDIEVSWPQADEDGKKPKDATDARAKYTVKSDSSDASAVGHLDMKLVGSGKEESWKVTGPFTREVDVEYAEAPEQFKDIDLKEFYSSLDSDISVDLGGERMAVSVLDDTELVPGIYTLKGAKSHDVEPRSLAVASHQERQRDDGNIAEENGPVVVQIKMPDTMMEEIEQASREAVQNSLGQEKELKNPSIEMMYQRDEYQKLLDVNALSPSILEKWSNVEAGDAQLVEVTRGEDGRVLTRIKFKSDVDTTLIYSDPASAKDVERRVSEKGVDVIADAELQMSGENITARIIGVSKP